MSDLSEVFRAGAANAWIFAPSAVVLGALHGLEPGHSKTMMAAFIVAVRGTVAQAVLLGLAATISHTAIVWAVALTGLYLGAQLNVEANEPYLQIVSGVLIIAVALWMTWRSWRDIGAKGALTAPAHDAGQSGASVAHGHTHDSAHVNGHVHEHVNAHVHGHGHGNVHAHDGGVPHSHQEEEFESALLDVDPTVYADAHEREHALDIERRFASRHVTTGQIILFGLTGGLIPCPASITVLLLCLQVGRIGLGALLVLCFSIGLALTLVLVGVAAALGMRHAASRWPGFEALAARAPYFSGAIVAAVGAYTIATGAAALA
ncbi:nickel/cobalt efflux transporter RcnA [Methylocystis sp. L43]|jgi:nickel/cobalt exporter|uniref:nickel/cobalt efflux transporter n=1 Tax=unclassified Methylocystis TaxID=2625913 RepID=UPI0018C339CB|nr:MULTISPECIES: nickel/cobalt efflux transporter [unclassified Methylocystis]MBG0796987.1 nickel/cobalt efflux transporter RcnA [Methylocystis sp. L43]MBG0804833.1 nickel/cobalt efflux transporter RcnA [Methylocystis sp. H15]